MLKVFEESARLYQQRFVTRELPSPPHTEEQKIGLATHLGLLEPERFETDIKVAPKCDKRTKQGKAAYTAFLQDCSPSSLVLEQEDMKRVAGMLKSLRSNPLVAALCSRATAFEKPVIWQCDHTGLNLKVKFDGLIPTGFFDLKTSANPRPKEFEKSVARYYVRQLCQYAEGYRELLFGEEPEIYYIVVGNRHPYDSFVYRFKDQLADECHVDWMHALERLAKCYETGVWLSPEQLQVTDLQLPLWGLGNKYVEVG